MRGCRRSGGVLRTKNWTRFGRSLRNNRLCSDLREWGESILFDERTLERGIFSPAFLRSIWARHQSGQEMHTIGKIAPIMTYEMMLRRLHD